MLAKAFILSMILTSFVEATAQSASALRVPTIAYCEFLSKPDAYDGKRVRIRAEYNSGFEHSVFSDSACVKAWDTKKLVWVEFDESINTNTRPKTLKRFREAQFHEPVNEKGEFDVDKWQKERGLNWFVELTVIGEFHKSKDSDFGFGHTNAYPLKLVVSRIEHVGALKKK